VSLNLMRLYSNRYSVGFQPIIFLAVQSRSLDKMSQAGGLWGLRSLRIFTLPKFETSPPQEAGRWVKLEEDHHTRMYNP